MPPQLTSVGMERKLTAILSADVYGYSRLMGEDEEATIRTLTAYREMMTALIQQYRGRVVDSPGDNLLAEFASVVDALRCAVEIQQEIKIRNAELPDHRRMEFRIGINLGDVVVEGERLYGDGVNIAARLESLAEPGGICISGTVYDHVETKLPLQYEYLGEQAVKNITKPVRVWRVGIAPSSSVPVSPSPASAGEGRGDGRLQALSAGHTQTRWLGTPLRSRVVLVFVLVLGGLVILLYSSLPPLSTRHSSLHTQEAQPPVLPLPDKPSIAVLPFTNMSGDPEQEYFSDGITDTLITDLSKLSELFVIARHSVFTYKGKAITVAEVGRELGVRYVVEGSIQKAGDRVRINTQLIDATTGGHLWAERYDRELEDIFALQDEIVQKIVTTLKLQLPLVEQGIQVRKSTDNLEAYDSYLRGLGYFSRYTKETNIQARQMFEKAIELDPQYATAYTSLSYTYWTEWAIGWNQDPQALERASELAQRAIALDDSLPAAHLLLGEVYLWKDRQHEQAITEGERAIALDPSFADAYVELAHILTYAGRPEEAIGLVQKAMRLNPRYPFHYLWVLGRAYQLTGRYEEALPILKKVLAHSSDFLPAYGDLVVIYSELGREEEARAAAAAIMRIAPHSSQEFWRQMMPWKDQAVGERFFAAGRRAGLK